MGLNNDYFEYITMAGDTFDMIALDAYSDEFKSTEIIKANPEYSGIIVFDAGVKLKIPILEEPIPESLPPWKR
mgnify:CR=1 FL=1